MTEIEQKQQRAAIYARLSDDKKTKHLKGDGENVQSQIKAARELASSKGLTVVDVYCDNSISATSGVRRPEFERLLEDAAAGRFDAVICRHVDRFFRSPKDQGRVCDVLGPRKIVIHQEWAGYPVDVSTPSGVMNLGIAAVISSYEIKHKSERQALYYEERRAAGEKPKGGGRSFGFKVDMTHNAVEAELLRSASDRVLEGMSLGALIREWNASEFLTTRGGKWGYSSMRALLMRWSNAGILQQTIHDKDPETGQKRVKEIVESGPANWEPIVEPSTFRALREKLADPSRVKHRGDVGRKHLLSHILKCGNCGNPLRAGTTTSRAGKAYRLYQCGGLKARCRLGIMYDVAEEVVVKHVTSRLANPSGSMLELTADERAALAEKQERLNQIADEEELVMASKINPKIRLRELERLHADREYMESSLAGLRRRMAMSGLLMDIAVLKQGESFADRAKVLAEVKGRFNALDLDRKREVIRLMCRVEVAPAVKGIRGTAETAAKRILITELDPATGNPYIESEVG